MDAIWVHIFDKPESSGQNNHDEGLDIREPKLNLEGGASVYGPIPQQSFTPFHNDQWIPRTHPLERLVYQHTHALATLPRKVDTISDEGA